MVLLINSIITEFFRNLAVFLPNFIGGLLILIIGLLLGGLVKHGLLTVFALMQLDSLVHRTKLVKKEQMNVWLEVLTEILKWMLVIGFLIPALEIWGLTNASAVLNQFLFY